MAVLSLRLPQETCRESELCSKRSIKEAGETLDSIDAIAVTYGPGLVGALLVGVAEAKALAFAKKKPLVGVHHIEGHICANYIEHPDLEPPFLCLVVSGGHTHLVDVKDYGKYEIIGCTRDDAAGEAFDKVARAIGLGYPGPKIEALAKEGDKNAIPFPRAKVNDSKMDFSFSGLKSSVLNYLNKCEMKGEEVNRADVAASLGSGCRCFEFSWSRSGERIRIQETCNRRWSCIQWSISCKNDREM